jgi:DNA-binding MarR family transcriptional regulator
MSPKPDDVQEMVVALFGLTAGLERARRQKREAAALSLLQVIGAQPAIRPKEIADIQLVHPSLVTRQLRELEDAGYVALTGDPSDGRSWLVNLTPAGTAEMTRLQQVGLGRFAQFVADWDGSEVRMLTALLTKLRTSIAAAADQERQQPAQRTRPATVTRRSPRAQGARP